MTDTMTPNPPSALKIAVLWSNSERVHQVHLNENPVLIWVPNRNRPNSQPSPVQAPPTHPRSRSAPNPPSDPKISVLWTNSERVHQPVNFSPKSKAHTFPAQTRTTTPSLPAKPKHPPIPFHTLEILSEFSIFPNLKKRYSCPTLNVHSTLHRQSQRRQLSGPNNQTQT